MSLTNLTSAVLARVAKLIANKEELQKAIASIDAELGAIESGGAAPTPVAAPPKTRGRKPAEKAPQGGRKRGEVTEKLLAELKAAGKAGLHVKELARRTGGTVGSVRTWYYSTGRKRGVRNIARGVFGLAA